MDKREEYDKRGRRCIRCGRTYRTDICRCPYCGRNLVDSTESNEKKRYLEG